jgi:hypothetical protein
MHKLAIVLFYTCAAISIAFTAVIFAGKARAEESRNGIDAQSHLIRSA